MYSKLPHLSNIYWIRHHSYITLLPSLSPTRTFLFFYSTLSYEILFTLYLNYLVVCGRLPYQLQTPWGAIWWLCTWTHGRRRCSKMTHEMSVVSNQGRALSGSMSGRKDYRTGYILLCASTFLICKIISMGKVELIRNHISLIKLVWKLKIHLGSNLNILSLKTRFNCLILLFLFLKKTKISIFQA